MEPPATISAPEPTEPSTVTSPSGNTTDWPERTGLSSISEATGAFTSGFSGSATAIAQARPPLKAGGMVEVSNAVSTPSMPRMRMFFFSRLTMRCVIAERLSSTAERSSTTGLPTKKPGERVSVVSSSCSHSMIGTTGVSTKAR
jgi:hypothetical protein